MFDIPACKVYFKGVSTNLKAGNFMGFWSSFRSVFATPKQDDAELEKLRAKHGIDAGEQTDYEQKKEKLLEDPYDPWEEVKSVRSNFFMGSWAARKFNVVGEDKVKKQLDALAKKREADRKAKEEEKSK
jgi:hypothetical protein